MGGINGDCRSQRMAHALEAGFENVVGIFPCKLYKVERSGHIAGKAPTFSVLQWTSQFRVHRPERSTAQSTSASSMGR